MAIKQAIIRAGFAGFRATGLHRLAGAATRGSGVILAFHRVRPWAEETPGYAPNRLLEITPEFLDEALQVVKANRFDIVTLDEARRRLIEGGPPFAVLTFDDGYRDTRDFALPILERHGAPFAIYCAIGFLERTARLWWLELEETVRRRNEIEAVVGDSRVRLPARTPEQKSSAFARLYWALRARPESELLAVIGDLASAAGIDSKSVAEAIFLDWAELRALSAHPLLTVGAHGVSHRRLAHWPLDEARAEMRQSKTRLEARLGRPVRHFAYPVGDRTSAARREFALASELGFETAVTMRPGMIFPSHAQHLTALPRVSINGLWQNVGALEVLLSGAPFLLWNAGRRVDAA